MVATLIIPGLDSLLHHRILPIEFFFLSIGSQTTFLPCFLFLFFFFFLFFFSLLLLFIRYGTTSPAFSSRFLPFPLFSIFFFFFILVFSCRFEDNMTFMIRNWMLEIEITWTKFEFYFFALTYVRICLGWAVLFICK